MDAYWIIERIERLGYAVSVHLINDMTEMHAVKLDCTEDPQKARCTDGNDPDSQYRCACLLAEAVGIDLEDA